MSDAYVEPGDGAAPGSRFRNTRDYLLPSTFEERGAAVPFTTPALLHARVRADWRKRLELVMTSLATAQGVYVVPWAAVKELVTLTAHDQMLHQSVLDRKALDPHAVRLAAFQVALTGIAGPEMASAAMVALKHDEEAAAFHGVLLVLQLIREINDAEAGELLRLVQTPAGQQNIRAQLGLIAERLEIPVDVLDQRLERLGDLTYTVGYSWSPSESRMRGLLRRLRAFQESTSNWAYERMTDASSKALFAAEVAGHTLGIAEVVLETFDAVMDAPFHLVQDEVPEEQNDPAPPARRLSWLLDGWDCILVQWEVAETDADRNRAITEIAPSLPLVPRDEVDEDDKGVVSKFELSSRRWTRAYIDWRTGEIDHEMVHRIELMRAREAENR